MTQPTVKRENPFLNILFNVLIPVGVLHQLSKRLGEDGPLLALIIALAFPIGYGIYDYIKNKHKNYISLFGLVSVLFTGGFALLHLQGIWFAVKEAAFPGLMAIGVAASSMSKRPLVATLFCNPQVMNMDLLMQKLEEKKLGSAFLKLQQRTTLWLASSFILSSLLNYFIAVRVFVPMDATLSASSQAEVLNGQIAKMTGLGFTAIAGPMMIFTGLILFFFLKRISQLTGLKLEEVLKS